MRGQLADWGVVPIDEEDGRVLASGGGAAVESAWRGAAEAAGVEICTGCAVTEVVARERRVAGVRAGGEEASAEAVVLAAGGCTYPALGGVRDGYTLAAALGHRIRPVSPAAVPLVTAERWTAEVSGVSLRAGLTADLPGYRRGGREGDVLFTGSGISGPLVLDVSGDVVQALAGAGGSGCGIKVWLDLLTAVPPDRLPDPDWWRVSHPARSVRRALDAALPASLASALCRLAGVPEATPCGRLTREAASVLRGLCRRLPLTVVDCGGFRQGMVTRGGVDVREIDPRTMQSRLVNGLYVAGEVLDIDGLCGGYNLQWAFSSGVLAGRSAGTAVAAC